MNNSFFLDGGGRVLNFGQAILLGLKDSMNPGGITGMMIFLVLLFWFFRWGIFSAGATGSFISGVWCATSAQAMGIFDFLFASREYDLFLDIVYFFWAALAMIFGSLFLKDWLVALRDGNSRRARIRLPFFEDQQEQSRQRLMGRKTRFRDLLKRLPIYMGIFFLGVLIALVEAAWAPDMYTVVLFYQLMTQGRFWLVVLALLLYGWGYVFPLLVVWLMSSKALTSQKIKERLCGLTSTIQIIFAALFLSYGFIIIFRYYVLV